MPNLKPYKLYFKGGLHLGSRGINLSEATEFIPSDTLFSALLDMWNRLGEDVEAFVAPYLESQPPFLLSSAFPFAKDLRFYPMPADLKRVFSADILDNKDWRKPLRKIRYISEGLLRKLIAGDLLDPYLFPLKRTADVEKGVVLQKGEVWLLKNEVDSLPAHFLRDKKGNKRALKALYYLDLWKKGEVPRVTIDRIAQSSTLYHAGQVHFAEGCGLWFGVESKDEVYLADFERALNALQDEGLGGERSSGYGAFEYEKGSDLKLPSAETGKAGYLLSRYHPAEAELPDALSEKNAAYQLVNVGGWLHTHSGADQRRKKLWMLEAGSIIHVLGPIQGSLTDTKPEYKREAEAFPHPVWRYGFALPIKFAEVK